MTSRLRSAARLLEGRLRRPSTPSKTYRHSCLGYLLFNSLRISGYNLSQNPPRSSVSCTGLIFGPNISSNTFLLPPPTTGVSRKS